MKKNCGDTPSATLRKLFDISQMRVLLAVLLTNLLRVFFNLFGLNPEFKFDTFSADVFVVNGAFFTFFWLKSYVFHLPDIVEIKIYVVVLATIQSVGMI